MKLGHKEGNLGDAELVIISAAIREDNPELALARKKMIPVAARAQSLAWLMSESTSIAVAGTHGKTTTTAMLAVALQAAGADPSFAVGGTINTGWNQRFTVVVVQYLSPKQMSQMDHF